MIVTAVVLMVVTTAFTVLSDRRRILFVVFETLLSPQVATIFEHITRVWMQSPKRSLARLVGRARYFNETVVER